MCTFFQWPQDIWREVENTCPYTTENYKNPTIIRPQLQLQAALNCPRCKSNNTKFCYYNNYSISQPRYLCKACKRYWTVGGILRNVPAGGGSRKTKRPSKSSNSNSKKKVIMNTIHDDHGQTLNSDFNNPLLCNGVSEFGDLGFELNFKNPDNSFMSMPVYNDPQSVFSSSSSCDCCMDHDIKPSLGFSRDGLENGYGNNFQENMISPTIIFPFDDELNPISTSDHQFQQDHDSTGCWIGMVNGGSW